MIQSNKFARRPFVVDAIQVTDENLDLVAEWCMGDVRTIKKRKGDDERYIKVRVHLATTERQTKAFVGDWVLYAGTSYKVYTLKAFERSFMQSDEEVDDVGSLNEDPCD